MNRKAPRLRLTRPQSRKNFVSAPPKGHPTQTAPKGLTHAQFFKRVEKLR